MPLTIKNVLENFDEEFVPENIKGSKEKMFYHDENHNNLPMKTVEKMLNIDKLKQFLKDNLTLILDSIEKELPEEIPAELGDYYSIGKNDYRQEVINIINSHK